jgi:CRP-like cAMP-binding protein
MLKMQLIRTTEAEKIAVLKNNPYFSDINPRILAEVIVGMRLYLFEKNETVFWEGDESPGLHMIRKGSVKLFKISPQGRELVIKVMDDGATFNEVPVFDHQPNPVNVSAVEDSEIWLIESDLLRRCITQYPELAQSVKAAVDNQLTALSREAIARQSLSAFGAIMVVDDLDAAIELANCIAPEHLELQVAEPMDVVPRLRNAGAVFLGNYTPEPVGDYMAGPNHVLPTAGTARFSSALSVDHFMKKTSLIRYSPAAFRQEARDIMCLANVEGLGGHANAIQVRLDAAPDKSKG